jgi:pantoate--beta-alanine ligase
VREGDGLALSSRNAYLTPGERKVAPTLYRVLKASAKRIKQGDPIEMVMEEGQAEIARAGFAVDYLEARHAVTLAPVSSRKDAPIRLLVAAKIGKTRLIDNLGV